ncbi:galactonate dehydratase [Singulisphaera sp. GP187]|uniref:mandelate racemase/muconate lactonizing enzyme family protein n=1 Tax=Singulisphaera sp. GP187 TaxID=1882752 RepID=UPI000927D335|nr:mandelate racemase/muconate lactonizing enzyme family protein [Singulisphaera sp. GP187]SIO34575.1 galactonate dehydratase [Singulisphaera sp. GP187]
MKIVAIRTAIVPLGFRNAVLTRIETDTGLAGVSEVVLKRASGTVAAHLADLSPGVIGQDPRRIEHLAETLYRDSFWVGGPLHATALSAIDIALWDLKGKALGVPIHELFGGPTRDEVPVYVHCPAGPDPASFAQAARRCVDRGDRALKVTLPLFYGAEPPDWDVDRPLGYSGSPGAIARTLKETEHLPTAVFDRIAAFFEAARQAVGPEIELAVDCHGRFNVANAKRLCDALAPFRLMFIEEPVPPENPEALAEVTRASRTPIAAGERWATIHGVLPFLKAGAVHLLQPDVVNCGGLTQARKIAALAEAYGIGLAPHNPNGPLATAASVQLAASIPNLTMLETIGGPEDEALNRSIVRDPICAAQGRLPVPQGPGLGLELLGSVWDDRPYREFQGWR